MPYYVTTPIYYVNAEPHLGHAYTTIVADVVARFFRLAGEEVFFQTGTDEHGDKIVQAASKAGLSPQDYVDKMSQAFRNLWPKLHIDYDNFIRTTDKSHKLAVKRFLEKVYEAGDIYFGEYGGHYCFGCERFLTEKELVDGLCPDHQTEPVYLKEANYFFRMSRYQDWLIDHIKRHPDFITPERYRNEVLSFLKEPLEDLCISRPKSRLAWGIELPFDDAFVTYVWFDALINYVSGLGWPEDEDRFSRLWPEAHHIIAKDILKPHGIYWPTMLRAAGLPPYRSLHVHGYWNVNEAKMSKSLGNIVRPEELIKQFGADGLRYFLLREMAFGLDANFSLEALRRRFNSDLANDFGNLVQRSLTMVRKYNQAEIPTPGIPKAEDLSLREAALSTVSRYVEEMIAYRFHRALASVFELIAKANKYIDQEAPWLLAKDPEKRERLETVLYHLLETLRIVAILVSPVMPLAAGRLLSYLGLEAEEALSLEKARVFGLLKPQRRTTCGPALFPRKDEASKKPKDSEVSSPKEVKEETLISIDDFAKVELRVAEIVAAEAVPKADRLLKLTVMAPEERTIVAGVAQHFRPEDLIGQKVIIVANLKPAKIRGVVSQGMMLVAEDKNGLHLITLQDAEPGAKVK
ncbi:methionine--tRNA ligase [Thermosulfuriphilus sp.]